MPTKGRVKLIVLARFTPGKLFCFALLTTAMELRAS
jgi:hypothetical protein